MLKHYVLLNCSIALASAKSATSVQALPSKCSVDATVTGGGLSPPKNKPDVLSGPEVLALLYQHLNHLSQSKMNHPKIQHLL